MNKIVRKSEENQSTLKKAGSAWYSGIMSGVSYMIPIIVAGGVMMGLLNLIFGYDATHDVANENLYVLYQTTSKVMGMMVPIFSAYIAYGIAGKPGLVPGLVGGLIMQGGMFGEIEIAAAGFLGAILTGGLAGMLVQYMKAIKVHKYIESVKTVILIPLCASFLVACISLYLIAPPVAALNASLQAFLESLSGSSLFVVGAIIGIMAVSDMGGPINKAAYVFSIGMWANGDFTYYAAFTLAKCIPGIIIGLSVIYTNIFYKDLEVYNEEEKDLSIAAIIMGICGITEGAIPYAAKDPLVVIPTCMVGSALGAGLVMASGIEIATGAGGSFLMLPLISEPGLFIAYSLLGIVISGVLLTVIKVARAKKHA